MSTIVAYGARGGGGGNCTVKHMYTFLHTIDMTSRLNLEGLLSGNECRYVIKTMLSSWDYDLKIQYIRYVIVKNEEMPGSGVAVTLSCDLSNFQWKSLIMKNPECDIMQMIVSLGGSLSRSDIENIVIYSTHENVLQFALEECKLKLIATYYPVVLLKVAISYRKFIFFPNLVPLVANEDLKDIVIELLRFEHYGAVAEILASSSSPQLVIEELNEFIQQYFKAQKFDTIFKMISDGLGGEIFQQLSVLELMPCDMQMLFEKALKCGCYTFAENLLEYYSPEEDFYPLIIKFLKLKSYIIVEELLNFFQSMDTHGIDKTIKQALKCKKFDIISEVISYGDYVNVEKRTALFNKALWFSEYKLAEACLKLDTDETIIDRVCLGPLLNSLIGQAIEERKEKIAFIKKLLDKKINPNGQEDELNSLDAVLALPRDCQTEKIELLTLLLQHGAQIERCTYQKKKQTTLIHIATRFAIESGRHSE